MTRLLYGEYENWISAVLDRRVTPQPRRSPDEIPAARAFWDLSHLNEHLPEFREVHEAVELRSREGKRLTAEVYVPQTTVPAPVMLYLHGGSWCLWSAAHLRRQAMLFAERGFVTVNLDYGLAPEHPFPWAFDDTVFALQWISDNITRYGGDPTRIVVAGDSAGANLVSGAVLTPARLEDDTPLDALDASHSVFPNVIGAVLLYGVFDFPLLLQEPGASRNTGVIETTWNQAYLGPNYLTWHLDPRVSPIYAANLDEFPPTYLSCGDRDSLLPQSLAMARALIGSGVETRLSVVPGADHEFLLLDESIRAARDELDDIYRWLDGLAADDMSETGSPT